MKKFFKLFALLSSLFLVCVTSCQKDDDDGEYTPADMGLAIDTAKYGFYAHYPSDSFISFDSGLFPPGGGFYYVYKCFSTRLKSDTTVSISYRRTTRDIPADSVNFYINEEKEIYDYSYGYSADLKDTTVNKTPASALSYTHWSELADGSRLLMTSSYYILYNSDYHYLFEIIAQAPAASDRWSLINSILGTFRFTKQ